MKGRDTRSFHPLQKSVVAPLSLSPSSATTVSIVPDKEGWPAMQQRNRSGLSRAGRRERETINAWYYYNNPAVEASPVLLSHVVAWDTRAGREERSLGQRVDSYAADVCQRVCTSTNTRVIALIETCFHQSTSLLREINNHFLLSLTHRQKGDFF